MGKGEHHKKIWSARLDPYISQWETSIERSLDTAQGSVLTRRTKELED